MGRIKVNKASGIKIIQTKLFHMSRVSKQDNLGMLIIHKVVLIGYLSAIWYQKLNIYLCLTWLPRGLPVRLGHVMILRITVISMFISHREQLIYMITAYDIHIDTAVVLAIASMLAIDLARRVCPSIKGYFQILICTHIISGLYR